jgi:dsDNA-specific endonuclease/ATPase MutS2
LTEDPIEVPIEDWIDLHTFRPEEIGSVVEEYLFQAQRKGYRQVRIIHGRGSGVQRAIVRSVLNKCPDAVAFRDTPDRGATIVHLSQPN